MSKIKVVQLQAWNGCTSVEGKICHIHHAPPESSKEYQVDQVSASPVSTDDL